MLGAVRRSDGLRSFYGRLRAAGTPAKLALVAAMRKLLCAVYNVAENREPFTVPTEQARRKDLLLGVTVSHGSFLPSGAKLLR